MTAKQNHNALELAHRFNRSLRMMRKLDPTATHATMETFARSVDLPFAVTPEVIRKASEYNDRLIARFF